MKYVAISSTGSGLPAEFDSMHEAEAWAADVVRQYHATVTIYKLHSRWHPSSRKEKA